jgi:hypothetical protein
VAISIDVTGLTSADYRFAVSPLAELVAVLHVLAEPAHHAHQRDLLSAAADALPAGVAHELRAVDYLFRTSRADMFLPARPAGTLRAELDQLDRLDEPTWVAAALLTSSCGAIPVIHGVGSPLTDPAARRIALDRAHARGPRPARFAADVLADPARARTRVRTLLEACAESFFDDLWHDLAPRLRRDARHQRDLFASTPGPPPVHAVCPSLTVNSQPLTVNSEQSTVNCQQLIVDKVLSTHTAAVDGLTLIPSVFSAPHLSVVHAPGWTPVIQYPVTAGPTRAAGPDQRILQRRLHALDNPIRYRMARSLARGPRTTLELADLWGLSSAEVSRHLAVLKEAGLAGSHRAGRRVVYTLDHRALASLGTDLTTAFLR